MPVPDPIPAARLQPGDFLADVDARDLVYFLLNVGDGDTQLLVLPEQGGARRAVVVDVGTVNKLPALLDVLTAGPQPLLAPHPQLFALVVATHPHHDHIGGMAQFLSRYHALIAEFWDPGYYHPIDAYVEMMAELEDHAILQSQPTSGLSRFIGNVRLQVLAPNIALRNRFDTYGVNINDASIALKAEFPAERVTVEANGQRRYLPLRRRTQSLVLGGDSQTLSWAHVMADFPKLRPDESDIAKQLRVRLGSDPLRANVFKVSHHGSKHGVNLELVEEIHPQLSFFSSVGGGGDYHFPHAISQDAVREGVEETTSGQPRSRDWELGIHYTGGRDDAGADLGTIALVLAPSGRKRNVWRFGDRPRDPVSLANARLFV